MPPLPRVVSYPHIPRFMPEPPVILAADGAIPIDVDQKYLVTKGSIAALTIAAPGVANVGRRIRILTGSDFAHVVTFTGATLRAGAGIPLSIWRSGAAEGGALHVFAASATTWIVESMNAGGVEP